MRALPVTVLAVALLTGCNDPPEGGAVSIGPESPTTSDDLVAVIDTAISDPNGDDLTLTWSWTRNGQPTEVTGETVASDLTSRGDVWEVTVVGSDGKEDSPPVTASITVVNTPPTATVSLPEEVSTDDDITATGEGSDVDGDAVTLEYSWKVDGAATAYDGSTVPSSATSKDQVWEVTASPRDQAAYGQPVSASVTIGNSRPSVASASVTPAELVEASVATCVGTGWSDADGDPEGYQTAWLVNDIEVTTDDAIGGLLFDKGDSVACVLTPFDGSLSGTPVTSAAVVVGNTAPSVSGGELDPSDARTTDDVGVFSTVTEDVDGDEVTLSYVWSVDGTPVGTPAPLPAASHAKGQEITVELTPFDGEDPGTPLVLGPLVIENTPPEVVDAAINASDIYTNDVIGVTLELFDADDDAVSPAVTWLVNGSSVSTGGTLDGRTSFSKGDTIAAEVVPNDGDEDGVAFTTKSVEVLNSPPAGLAVVLDGSVEGEAIQCVIDTSATDLDGDSIRYTATWTVDGSAYSSPKTTTFTGDTIPTGVTKEGEEWICTVTPNDGEEDGATATASVKVKRWAGIRTFNHCAATGQNGPTQAACNTSYAGSTLAGEVTVSGGKQIWTVPTTGTYRIEAYGAQGISAETGRIGGLGARMRGDFPLRAGDKLEIVVGQTGVVNSCNGGGGGGSFVVRSDGTPFVVAGGGGGTRAAVDQNGCSAATAQMAGTGSMHNTTHGCGLKASSTIGDGGIVSSSSWGSGAGAITNNGTGEYDALNGGRSFTNGATGGGTSAYPAYGGFGGGGSGNGGCGGGGGGGYSGGDGGRLAGAGGSYNGGSSQSNSAGARSGDGLVTIDLL